jgi:voltage-gated hydrogen channel 1
VSYCLLGRDDPVAYNLIGVAVGAGEIEEDTYRELARVKRELEDSRSAFTRAQDETQELRARITWLESQASTV